MLKSLLQDVQTLRNITQNGKRKSINDFSSTEIQNSEKWARKEGKRGVTADQIKSELEELIPGIRIDAINEVDIFLALDEMYCEASKLIKESTPQKHELLGYL